MENLSSNALEAEIVALQQKIEAKKNLLEREHGIIEEGGDKELLRQSVTEMFAGQNRAGAISPLTQREISTGSDEASYLDRLDSDSAETVNRLIAQLPQTGIAKAVATAELAGPFVVDVLHDLLVDRLYDEMKARGIIK